MGVQGLWTLLSPAGRKLKIEALEGQKLAIDVSIWVIRMLYGFASRKANSEFKNIHLVGIFKRLCRLLSLGIKPVFVFDGKAPELKRHTLYLRQQMREKRQINLKKLAEKYVIKQLEGKLKSGKGVGGENTNKDDLKNDLEDDDDLDSLNSDEMNEFEKNLNDFQMTIVDTEFQQILSHKRKYPNLLDGIIENEQQFHMYDIASKVGVVQAVNQRLNEIRNKDLSKITDMEQFSILQSKSYVEYVTNKKEVNLVRDEGRKNLLEKQQNYMIDEATSSMTENQKKTLLNDPKNKIITGQSKSEHDKMFLFVQKAFEKEDGEAVSNAQGNKIGLIIKPIRKSKQEKKIEIQSRLNDLIKARESSAVSWYKIQKQQREDEESTHQLHHVMSKIDFKDDDDDFLNDQSINFADLCGNSSKKQKSSKKYEDTSDLSFGDDSDNESCQEKEDKYDQEEEEKAPIKEESGEKCLEKQNSTQEDFLNEAMIQSSSQASICEEQPINFMAAIESQDKRGTTEESQRSSLADTQKRISDIVKAEQRNSYEILKQRAIEQSQRLIEMSQKSIQINTEETGMVELKEEKFLEPIMKDTQDSTYSNVVSQKKIKEVENVMSVEYNGNKEANIIANTDEEIDQVKFLFDQQQRKQKTVEDDDSDLVNERKKREKEEFEKLIQRLKMEEEMQKMDESDKKKYALKNHSVLYGRTGEDEEEEDEEEDPEEMKKLLAQVEKWEDDQNKHVEDEVDLTDEQLEEEYQRFLNLGELDSETIQDKFQQVRQLLLLFGVPWVEAPSEAEAQCAFLESTKLVDGIITDDSDVFLFGGKNIYRGLFGKEVDHVRYINREQIERDLGIDQDKLIFMALFLGSDYTLGIKGIGIVNAMEICTAFENIDALKRFKMWASKADVLLDDPSIHYKNISLKEKNYKELHKNYKKHWEMPDDFPSQRVVTAYKNPNVDHSDEPFQWGKPSIGLLRAYCQNVFAWGDELINYILKPLEDFLNRKPDPQKKITDYYRNASKFAIINSSRLKNAIRDLKQNEAGDLESRLQNEVRIEKIMDGIVKTHKNANDKKRITMKKGAVDIEEEDEEDEQSPKKQIDQNDDDIDDDPFDTDLNGFQYNKNKNKKKKKFFKRNIF